MQFFHFAPQIQLNKRTIVSPISHWSKCFRAFNEVSCFKLKYAGLYANTKFLVLNMCISVFFRTAIKTFSKQSAKIFGVIKATGIAYFRNI
jgi:hypothetical protein